MLQRPGEGAALMEPKTEGIAGNRRLKALGNRLLFPSPR